MSTSCALNVCNGYYSLSAVLYDLVAVSFINSSKSSYPTLPKRVTTVLAFIPLTLAGIIGLVVRWPLAALANLAANYIDAEEGSLIKQIASFLGEGCIDCLNVIEGTVVGIQKIFQRHKLSTKAIIRENNFINGENT